MSDMQKSTDEDKDPTKPSEVDHGETPQYIKDRDAVAEETMKDPGGNTPAQQRPDKQPDDAFIGDEPRPLSGMAPQEVSDPDNTEDPQVGGTLPGV